MQYAQRAILIKEFTDPRWQNLKVPGSAQSVGDNQLATYGFVSHYWSAAGPSKMCLTSVWHVTLPRPAAWCPSGRPRLLKAQHHGLSLPAC